MYSSKNIPQSTTLLLGWLVNPFYFEVVKLKQKLKLKLEGFRISQMKTKNKKQKTKNIKKLIHPFGCYYEWPCRNWRKFFKVIWILKTNLLFKKNCAILDRRIKKKKIKVVFQRRDKKKKKKKKEKRKKKKSNLDQVNVLISIRIQIKSSFLINLK